MLTYYVSTSASGAGDGSAGNRWTLSQALSAATAGLGDDAQILLGTGTYSTTLALTLTPPSKRVTLRSESFGGAAIVWQNGYDGATHNALTLNSRVAVSGLRLEVASTTVKTYNSLINGADALVRRCVLRIASVGQSASGYVTSNVRIDGCLCLVGGSIPDRVIGGTIARSVVVKEGVRGAGAFCASAGRISATDCLAINFTNGLLADGNAPSTFSGCAVAHCQYGLRATAVGAYASDVLALGCDTAVNVNNADTLAQVRSAGHATLLSGSATANVADVIDLGTCVQPFLDYANLDLRLTAESRASQSWGVRLRSLLAKLTDVPGIILDPIEMLAGGIQIDAFGRPLIGGLRR